jgi:hypothetical protein
MFEQILMNENLNVHFTKRYIKFIKKCSEKNQNLNDGCEKHHILPVSIYPQYRSFKKHKWNMCKLSLRQHFIAHWMLAKIFGGKQWFSFNQMKRWGGKSILYEYGRVYLSKHLSEINRGREKTIENRKSISERTKNTVVVKDNAGNMFRVSVHDERYISGELTFYRKGFKNTPETIEKMRKNNGISGKKLFNEHGKAIYLHENEGLERGLQIGPPQETKNKLSKIIKNTIWVTDKKSGRHLRIKECDFNPANQEKGRKGFHGFEYINRTRSKTI